MPSHFAFLDLQITQVRVSSISGGERPAFPLPCTALLDGTVFLLWQISGIIQVRCHRVPTPLQAAVSH